MPLAPNASRPETFGDAPAGLLEAVLAYESALMTNDLDALDRYFAPGDETLRGDAAGLLVGHDAISRFRVGRGGAPKRRLLSLHTRAAGDDAALVIAVFAPSGGGRGQQTQLWRRDQAGDAREVTTGGTEHAGRWMIAAAHVSGPQPAVDTTVWRVVGTPLVAATADGPLAGLRVAVKDLFAVAGHPIGGGVPRYLAEAAPEETHAPAVAALLVAGASVTGIARTDEFAYSIAGRNPHYGTPPNPAVVGGIPGGSSNGPASAVALGHVHVGLGTDTGGSIRVPASYQGLWGLRTTHGAVDRTGLLPLAPSFDTVGWLTRDAATLRAATVLSLRATDSTTDSVEPRGFVVSPAVTALADHDVQAAFASAVSGLVEEGVLPPPESVELLEADDLFEAFRTVQAAEAWRTHGPWIERHPGALGADIASRFAWAAGFGPDAEAAARAVVEDARAELARRLDGRVLLLPAASSAAPQVTATAAENETTRARTLRLTCFAGILGAPALSVPLLDVAAGPVGLCLVGPRGSDLALIDLADGLVSE